MKIALTILAVVIVILIIGIIINNRIVARKNQMAQAFGSIEIYLKKRFDLIPNLVSAVQQYMSHEKEILIKVTELRTQAETAQSPQEKIDASNQLTNVMKGLNISVENYPNLKSDQHFLSLQNELAVIEDQISAARRAYNAGVTAFNTTIEKFPASIVAGMRKDRIANLLEIPKEEQKEVNINQLFNA